VSEGSHVYVHEITFLSNLFFYILQCLVAKFEAVNLVQTISVSLAMHLRNRRKVIPKLFRCFRIAGRRIWFKAVMRITDPELETKMHSHICLVICRINNFSPFCQPKYCSKDFWKSLSFWPKRAGETLGHDSFRCMIFEEAYLNFLGISCHEVFFWNRMQELCCFFLQLNTSVTNSLHLWDALLRFSVLGVLLPWFIPSLVFNHCSSWAAHTIFAAQKLSYIFDWNRM